MRQPGAALIEKTPTSMTVFYRVSRNALVKPQFSRAKHLEV
jgi:hypothetical protein